MCLLFKALQAQNNPSPQNFVELVRLFRASEGALYLNPALNARPVFECIVIV